MEGNADGEIPDLDEKLGCGRGLIIQGGEQAARPGPDAEMVKNEETICPGLGEKAERLLDGQLGEGTHDLVRSRRVGRADDARIVPGNAPRKAVWLL